MPGTLHVVSLPHTTLTEQHATCAYSMKVRKFVPMMRARGYRVVLYGPDLIDCEPDEHVVVSTQADRERWGFGSGFDTVKDPLKWDAAKPYWFETNVRAIDAIKEREQHGDFLCLITGTQWPIAEQVKVARTVEWAVGYEGIFTNFCAFESYAWMHHVHGLKKRRHGRAFDQVIPNFFDPQEFPRTKKPTRDYLLYVGRMIHRKGVVEASAVAERVGMPLIMAGPGGRVEKGVVYDVDGNAMTGDVQYVGEVGFARRAELMGNAACLLAPTLYIEPFGGVVVEAMMCGTPVVASDWGSFTEIVTPEVGRRFRTLKQGARAVEESMKLSRGTIRDHAIRTYSLDAVGKQFDAWFEQLSTLDGDGWYA